MCLATPRHRPRWPNPRHRALHAPLGAAAFGIAVLASLRHQIQNSRQQPLRAERILICCFAIPLHSLKDIFAYPFPGLITLADIKLRRSFSSFGSHQPAPEIFSVNG